MRTTKFKASEIGPIPVEWEVKRLGEIASLITKGTTPTSVGCAFTDYGINFIKAESITESGAFLVSLFAHIDEQTNAFLSRSVLKEGDYLFSIAGVLGRVALVPETLLPANTNQALAIIRLDEQVKICRIFLFFALKSEYIQVQIQEENVAAAQANLSLQEIGKLCVALPPLAEQYDIAEALSDADAWIESLDNLIEKKKLVKQGAMQALLSGKTRLPGFSGEWTREAIGDEFDFLRTNTLARACLGDNGSIADVHYGDVLVRYGNILDFSTETPPFIEGRFESRSIGDFLRDGDLVMADTAEDEMVGKAVEIQNLGNRRAVAGLHTVACRPKHPFAPRWLGHFVNSPAFHNQLLPLISGTKVSLISKENLKTVFVLRPPLAEQAAIAEVLSDMDAELAALSREKAKAEQIKQGMMQELLTGKTRLVKKGE
ncbi:MAG: restriction endonuclease subunit S [Kiritimatiellae bacterium]|nr:restriction endonuclease subunit S [Bacteroidales bacterium]MBR3583863.1 restriction endonuclease subunit S [Kiritimatiellia bacterium]